LKMALATIHEPLFEIRNKFTIGRVFEPIDLLNDALKDYFNYDNPRIGVAALNPHAGESGQFGDEEQRIIRPAISLAREQGINCCGPFSADTLFLRAVKSEFDGVVAMYHDQGMIPVKLVGFERASNKNGQNEKGPRTRRSRFAAHLRRMQTKQQIRELLQSAGISPNKRLGQHFLIDLNLMRLLVDSAGIEKDDVVLEVGCGTGSLTEALADRAGKVISVEIDRKLAKIATERVADTGNVDVINADILETGTVTQAKKMCPGRFLLVANLPYNVASPVMLNLATGKIRADAMYVTVQKEVADRMTSGPGSADYGILSILLAATGSVKLLRTLKPTVFWPRPQVDSAMVSYVREKARSERIADVELFVETVHLFMSHRRKTVQSCCRLAEGRLGSVADWRKILEECRIDPAQRPEKLGPENYVAIAEYAAKSPDLY